MSSSCKTYKPHSSQCGLRAVGYYFPALKMLKMGNIEEDLTFLTLLSIVGSMRCAGITLVLVLVLVLVQGPSNTRLFHLPHACDCPII